MPYIKQHRRAALDEMIEDLGRNLEYNGDLNYILFALCKRHIAPSYNNYKGYIGELEECVAEIRRRLLGPYEDAAIAKNGDVT